MQTSFHRIKLAIAASAVALLGLAMAACGSSESTGTSSAGGDSSKTLQVAFNSGLATIDPAFACDRSEYTVIRALYDQLVQSKPAADSKSGADVEPMLAKSWKTSKDGTTTTFELRDDVKFASGNPVTADDVVFSLNRGIDKEACANYVITAGLPDNFQSVKKLGPTTVQVVQKKPDPLFMESIASRASSIIDSKLLKQHGGLSAKGDDWLASHGAGSGAYTLDTYRPDSEINLTATPDYWQGEQANSGVSIKIVTDPTTLETLTKSGQSNLVLGLTPKTARQLEDSGTKIASDPSQFTTYFGMNNTKPPLDNVKVRQALAAVVPAKAISDQFGYGFSAPFVGPIPPAMDYYPDLPLPEPDVEKGKQLIEESGVSNPSFQVDIENGESTHADIATVLQDAFKQIGVDMQIKTLGSASFTDRVYNFKSDSYIIDDGPTINDPGYFLGYLVRCGEAFNWAQYCNKSVDQKLEQARFSLSSEERAELYRQVSDQVISDAPYVSIWAKDNIVALPGGTTGYQYYTDQIPRLNAIGAG